MIRLVEGDIAEWFHVLIIERNIVSHVFSCLQPLGAAHASEKHY